jgi:hypothetical protein
LPGREKLIAMAQTIRDAFEPEVLLSRAVLQEQVVPKMIQLLEQVCDACEQQIHERLVS